MAFVSSQAASGLLSPVRDGRFHGNNTYEHSTAQRGFLSSFRYGKRTSALSSVGKTQGRRITVAASTSSDENSATAPSQSSGLTPFPALYDAWFEPSRQLATQAVQAIEKAYGEGIRTMELQWPVVPNLEEIAAGTLLNFEFGKQAARSLQMAEPADYALIKRYLASFCNVYWACQLADAEPFSSKTVWVLSTDSVSKTRAVVPANVRVESLRDAKRLSIGDEDVVILLDPRFNEVWKRGLSLRPENGCLLFLNSQFNESYGLTGPRRGKFAEIEAVYFLKRVTRGYVFFSYPGPWRACLECPDLSIDELETFDETPALRTVAARVREESNSRYGGFYNDRYVQGFGGRL